MLWPGSIPAGTRCDELAVTIDLLPTLANLAGAELDLDLRIDGKDIWTLMSGRPEARSPHDRYFYYFKRDLHAVRSGPWKLFVKKRPDRNPVVTPSDQNPILYNLDDDIGETSNVAAQHPEVVQRLMEYIRQAREDLGDGDREGRGTAITRARQRRHNAHVQSMSPPFRPLTKTATLLPIINGEGERLVLRSSSVGAEVTDRTTLVEPVTRANRLSLAQQPCDLRSVPFNPLQIEFDSGRLADESIQSFQLLAPGRSDHVDRCLAA